MSFISTIDWNNMTDYQANRLEVTERRIEVAKQEAGIIKRNFIKIILFGTVFCLLCPFYGGDSETIIDMLGGSYWYAVLFVTAVYVSLMVIGHVGFTIQDKTKIKRLLRERERLLTEISEDSRG